MQELDRPYAENRRSAVKRLGEIGVMSDTPALIKRLRDADWLTRALYINPNLRGVEINIRKLEQEIGEKRKRTI